MATDGPAGPTSARSAIPIDPPSSGGRLQGIRLARRASRGDRAAFEQIFRRHHQELYRYSLAIVHDREDAEDAMQATMAAALRALPGEDRRIDIRPWLFRIAHNESISLLRRRPPDQLDEASIPEREGESQEDRLAIRDRLRRLVLDLNGLPERQRAALVMRELSGLSYEEIGEALTCSEGGARQAVYEARTALRELEEGRDMECEAVRRAISERDGRRLRGRKLRAHLNGCDGCSGFAAAIPARRADLGSLCPPLPAAAAGTILTGLLGGGGGAATGAGAAGIAGGGMAASLAIKGGSIAAAIALAAGAADVGGLIDLPNPVAGSKASTADPAAPDPTAADARAQPASAASTGTGPSNHAGSAHPGDGGDACRVRTRPRQRRQRRPRLTRRHRRSPGQLGKRAGARPGRRPPGRLRQLVDLPRPDRRRSRRRLRRCPRPDRRPPRQRRNRARPQRRAAGKLRDGSRSDRRDTSRSVVEPRQR